jgi:hypothetical protein
VRPVKLNPGSPASGFDPYNKGANEDPLSLWSLLLSWLAAMDDPSLPICTYRRR